MVKTLLDRLPVGSGPADPDAVYTAFEEWAADRGLTLYSAQADALIEIVSGSNVVLSTPTGTGKSLVAAGAHFFALAEGRRSYYTAPIKALVSEKFFALVDIFGAANVGMVTGDSSVNADAPIICCTAEILANLALRHGAETDVDQVVMDEFHFYGDPERGWAWQVPLLTLPRVQFVLMSATLGDVTWLSDDLARRTGRETAVITGVERPVPLHYGYALTPVQETVEDLLGTAQAPIYIVHFSQAAALERAQALTSINVATRAQRDLIAETIGGFRFTTSFGRILSRLVRAGIGVHHAGMLPKYRRLVEQLAQQGMLRVICGTDTLGVGINVPIRSVLLTALTKYDGTRMRQLTAREFHQVAGRAGRAGFDTAGTVVCQAPEHETENARLVAKAGDDAKKLKRIVRKRAPDGFVSWGQPSFERLIAAEPETLTSSMQITHAMLLNIVGRGGDSFEIARELIFGNHEPRPKQLALARQALAIYRTLRTAEIVHQEGGGIGGHARITVMVDLQPNFALNQPLSPFALAVFDLLQPGGAPSTGSGTRLWAAEPVEAPDPRAAEPVEAPDPWVAEPVEAPDPWAAEPVEAQQPADTYALDMISVLESTLDDPRPVLSQQQFIARGEAVAAMKAAGIEYDQRMELLEAITWPKPLEGLLGEAFSVYSASQPWIGDFELSPKSVVRDLYERAMTFVDYINFYKLARSEGLVLRYLSDAYRAARQTIPDEFKSEELTDLIEWLGELVRQVDSSLLDEWEELTNPIAGTDAAAPVIPPTPKGVTGNSRAFRILVRNELFRRVMLAAREDWAALGELDAAAGFDADAWADALDPYWDEHDSIGTHADARSAAMLVIDETSDATQWRVRQILADPAGDHDWSITAIVDLEQSREQGVAVVRVTSVGMSEGVGAIA